LLLWRLQLLLWRLQLLLDFEKLLLAQFLLLWRLQLLLWRLQLLLDFEKLLLAQLQQELLLNFEKLLLAQVQQERLLVIAEVRVRLPEQCEFVRTTEQLRPANAVPIAIDAPHLVKFVKTLGHNFGRAVHRVGKEC
jgi:hypothetical protein